MEVLVPVDGSDSARRTVSYAVRAYPEATVTVLHVVTPSTAYSPGMGDICTDSAVIEARREHTDSVFATAIEAAEEHGGSVTTDVGVGSPVRAILAFADDAGTDHIVMGNSGRSGIRRLLFKNVTEGVLRGSSVPVTVVN